MLLTKSTTFIIGPVANLLGYIMDAIFNFCNNLLNIPNIGLCIILFTVVVYLLLMPLTVKQQKFSKLQAKMGPEIQAINKKYKGKQDQVSVMKMQEETKAVYAKYGVSPMGSCLQMLIQMPILFALYRVIWNIPAYVSGVKEAFMPLVNKLLELDGAQAYLTDFATSNQVNFEKIGYSANTIVDTLYKFKPSNWSDLSSQFPQLSTIVTKTQSDIDNMNFFLGLNIADSPMNMIKDGFAAGSVLLVIGALMIPLLAGVTQWLNTKLMPQPAANNNNTPEGGGAMASSMKTMNTVMPIMSMVFCLSLPAGMGIYWIAGAVIRSIQQVVVNRHLDRIDLDELVKKNLEKENKKREKMGLPPQKITNQAKVNVRSIEAPDKKPKVTQNRDKQIKDSTDYYKSHSDAKPGSLAARARMVEKYNEKNRK